MNTPNRSSEKTDPIAPLSENLQKCKNNFEDTFTNTKVKRINKNDPTRWSFSWGPPV